MPVNVTEVKTGQAVRMKLSDYRERRSQAFHAGALHYEFQPKYTFEAEAYEMGVESDRRIQTEIDNGSR